ncbi:hypothetical protein [Streptomyces bohaiensis]|uniref:Uncharacterized protein n=1 Tax=Streptomyces bohaiensis TaxID=1431344 RepID=A0ABX1C5K1_9ACTN|nr:hypothetical protein [Streptomyces bohaiensis]NJQ14198.1 hypothetical protein [Streptomyces bohaiensis]
MTATRPSASAITDDQLDALYAEVDRLRARVTGGSTSWPQAAPLQAAATALRAGTAAPVPPADLADLLDALARALGWLAPYRPHEGGHAMWTTATAVAEAITDGASR